MLKNIRARISAAFVAMLGIAIIVMAAFAPQQAAAAYYGGSFRSYSAPVRVYSAPRVYVAPRAVYAAPRPVVVVRPRPLYVAPRPVIVAPVVPYVAPPVVVPSDGQPVAVAVPVQHPVISYVYLVLLILLIVAVLGGVGYGICYFDPFDIWVDDSYVTGVYVDEAGVY